MGCGCNCRSCCCSPPGTELMRLITKHLAFVVGLLSFFMTILGFVRWGFWHSSKFVHADLHFQLWQLNLRAIVLRKTPKEAALSELCLCASRQPLPPSRNRRQNKFASVRKCVALSQIYLNLITRPHRCLFFFFLLLFSSFLPSVFFFLSLPTKATSVMDHILQRLWATSESPLRAASGTLIGWPHTSSTHKVCSGTRLHCFFERERGRATHSIDNQIRRSKQSPWYRHCRIGVYSKLWCTRNATSWQWWGLL